MTGTNEQEWTRLVNLLVHCRALHPECLPEGRTPHPRVVECWKKVDAAVKHLVEMGTLTADEIHGIGNLVYLACRASYSAPSAVEWPPAEPAQKAPQKPATGPKPAQQTKSRLGSERPANGRRKERT